MRNILKINGLHRIKGLIPLFFLCFVGVGIHAQDVDQAAFSEGEKLFKANCASCHVPTAKKLIGPGLEGITQKRDREWLYKWIKNSTELIKSGDKDAVAIFEEYNKVVMPPQPLTNEQIDKVLYYVENYAVAQQKQGDKPSDQPSAEQVTDTKEDSSGWWIWISIIVLIALIIALKSLYYHLLNLKNAKEGLPQVEEPSIVDVVFALIRENKAATTVVIILILLVLVKKGWDVLFNIGVYQGYQPVQPIQFSHQIHAGINKIDCNYCHSSARHSKHAGIPSANVCMNCHKVIQEGTNTGTEEIAKIYKAVGFDPQKGEYIAGYEEKPIKWVKVHNLPDHVFFSHQQHVVAGQIECQTCHGPVQDSFTVAKQWAPLTMKWCIDCHRETKVQDAGNGYYDEWHARLPKHLKEMYMKDGKITVSEIGGLECGKCHY